MNIQIDEEFSLSAYHAVITADEDLLGLLNENLVVVITDTIEGESKVIDYSTLMNKFGLTKTTNDDFKQWFEESFLNNNGFCFIVNGNKIEIKQLTKMYNKGSSASIGYNPSKIDIYFDGLAGTNYLTLKSKFFPFIKRTLPYKLNESDDEPILSDALNKNIRVDFDYNANQNIKEFEKIPDANFKYNTVGDLYVNNVNSKSYTHTPLYVSDCLAYYANHLTGEDIKIKDPKSYIFDAGSGEETDIDFEELQVSNADFDGTIESYVNDKVEYNPYESYMTSFIVRKYRQFIRRPEDEYKKNQLILELNAENGDITPPPEPPPTVTKITVPNRQVVCSMNYSSKWGRGTYTNSEDWCFFYDRDSVTGAPVYGSDLLKPIKNNNESVASNHQHILKRAWTSEAEYTEDVGFTRLTVNNPNHVGTVEWLNPKTEETEKVFYLDPADKNYVDDLTHVMNEKYIPTEEELKNATVWSYAYPIDIDDVERFKVSLLVNSTNEDEGPLVNPKYDTVNYLSEGYINVDIYNIKIHKDATTNIITVTFNLAADSASWGGYTTDEHTWTLKNNPFIPPAYDDFRDYVIYTEAYLTLDKAYIGVKKVQCAGITAFNNSALDCEVNISGEEKQSNFNLQFWNLNDSDKEWKTQNGKVIAHTYSYANGKTTKVMPSNIISITDGDPKNPTSTNGIWRNPSCPTLVNLNKNNNNLTTLTYIRAGNPAFIQDIVWSDIKKMDIPKYNVTYSETAPSVYVPLNATVTINNDNPGKVVEYNVVEIQNNAKLIFMPGEYHIKKLDIKDHSTIEIANCAGYDIPYVRICVENDIDAQTVFTIKNKNTGTANIDKWNSFQLYCEGNISIAAGSDPNEDSDNEGVIICPNGTVDMREQFYWKGAIWAKNITLGGGCIFQSVDFT